MCLPLLVSPGVNAAESIACAACHRAIYDSYQRTAMAASSGRTGQAPVVESFARSSFTHAASGFHYRIHPDYSLEFEKAGTTGLDGKVTLSFFIGSGAAARSYLLASAGFLFEAPVAYYSANARWDLAPAYDHYAYPYTTRPAVPTCLNCHASFLSLAPGTLNRYGDPPFREGGVACERCHGPGEAHIEKMKGGAVSGGSAILNPAKLAADRRDSICAQCHLSGEVRVFQPGKSWNSYRAGDRLAESVSVFVRARTTPGMRVTSHFEKLALSACQRASGGRMWCGSCHDPHAVPAAAERVAWFRRKCENCHAANACKEIPAKRERNQDNCIGCHMPKTAVADAQHVVYTDHSIPRRPVAVERAGRANAELIAFGNSPATDRNLALAYAIAGNTARARPLLEAWLAKAPGGAGDSEPLLYLAEIYRNSGQAEKAIPLYRRAMELDPSQVTASAGLGAILFERGQDAEAIRLWQDALSRSSGLVLLATNLAMAQWRTGDLDAAASTLRQVIRLSPGFPPARDLLLRLGR